MQTIPTANPSDPHAAAPRRRWLLVLIGLVLVLAIGSQLGVYTIQPIGAIPEGRTIIIWRAAGEPLFNSPDAECLRIQQGVSLLCRGVALSRAPVDRIVVRLPYQEWAYLIA